MNSMIRLLLGPGLLGTYGGTHKKQRKMLNPVFSGAHMRNLTPLFYDVAGRVRRRLLFNLSSPSLTVLPMQLRTALESRVEEGPKDLDVLAWMGRTALELVGRGGLGYSFDPLVAESRDVFTESVKSFMFVSSVHPAHRRGAANRIPCGIVLAPLPTRFCGCEKSPRTCPISVQPGSAACSSTSCPSRPSSV